MSRTVYEGKNKVIYCPAVADIQAPTEAEIGAGTDLSPFVTKDGISVPNAQNMVDSATIEDTFDAQQVGSWGGGPVTLTMFRDDTDETDSYDLIEYGLEGYLVISRFGAPVASSKVEVWPVEFHEPTLMQSAANEMQKFSAAAAVTGSPAMRAVVAAS
jgi:hypothetical protein